jgi:hypothetical protein
MGPPRTKARDPDRDADDADFDQTTSVAMPQSGAAGWVLLRALRNVRKGLKWAWLDTICQYRRSKIGPF